MMITIYSLAGTYIKWPDTKKHKEILLYLQEHYQFPHCVSNANGTLFPLAFEPQCQDAPDYSEHKFGGSLSSMIVCDYKKASSIIWLNPQAVHMAIVSGMAQNYF